MNEIAKREAPGRMLIMEGDPEAQLDYAQRASKALMQRVEAKPKKVIINGKQYLEFGDWQTLARFFGATVGVEWTKPIERNGELAGYEARTIVWQHGQVISSAEASCLRDEKNWARRDEFALKSMAQTRAGSKALRNAFGWVAELAGYSGTPAEEMDGENDDPEEKITSKNTALFNDLDSQLAAAAEKGLNALQELWGGFTLKEQKLMAAAKDRRHKPRAVEVSERLSAEVEAPEGVEAAAYVARAPVSPPREKDSVASTTKDRRK